MNSREPQVNAIAVSPIRFNSPLSIPLTHQQCRICKARKVKCDRLLPRCSRCASQKVECVYPERQKKKPTKSSKDRTAELEALFARLQRVESTITSHGIPGRLPTQSSVSHSASPLAGEQIASPDFPTPDSLPTAHVVPNRRSTSSPWMSVLKQTGGDDIASEMEDAVKRISAARLRKMFHTAQSTKAIHIPPELAKTWVRSELTRNSQTKAGEVYIMLTQQTP